jgi:hypothetical protein
MLGLAMSSESRHIIAHTSFKAEPYIENDGVATRSVAKAADTPTKIVLSVLDRGQELTIS